MQRGAPWIHQGVLLRGDRLGIPDLLRRVEEPSALGAWHYEVVDVKSSGRPRGDQILQVAFYSRLLGELQGCTPAHGALVLKDGRTETFAVADYDAACAEVEQALRALRQDPAGAEPFLCLYCESCHWNHRCLPELEAARDLSLLHGMTPGARHVLRSLGVRTADDLATFEPHGERQRGHLEPALVRRLRKAAQARLVGAPVPERRPLVKGLRPGALVHLLTDPYTERALWIGVLETLDEGAPVREAFPASPDDAWTALRALLEPLPPKVHLLHFGPALPELYEAHAHRLEDHEGLEARFVEIGRRLRGAALYPGPVPLLQDLVRHGLQRDPLRAGHPGECAMWCELPDARRRLATKGRADLDDLRELVEQFLPEPQPAQETEGETACS
jgi:predicted RecB family nuclease